MQLDQGIQLNDVTIELGDKVILKDVNIKVNDQETVVLIGPSGTGKSVLLKTIAGIILPSKGEVHLLGTNVQNLEFDEKHDFAKKLGMFFQQSGNFDKLTALENVAFPIREHLDLPEEEILSLSKKLLDKVNLLDSAEKIPSELSGGMQKRLGIARALALNPRIIFCDDPVAGQDPVQADQMLKLIKDYQEKSKSILIIITSDIRVAYRMADRIFMIIDQEVIDAGSPDEIKNHPDPRIQQFIHGNIEGPIKSL